MRRSVRAGVGHAWLLWCSLVPVAAGAPIQDRPSNAPFRVRSDLVVIDAQVIEPTTGRSVPRLLAEDFEIAEDGVRQQVTHFGRDSLPLSLVLVLDCSPSVLPLLSEIHAGARRALHGLRSDDAVAAMAFGTSSELVADFTQDRDRLLGGIAGLDAASTQRLGEATYLHDAIYRAAAHLAAHSAAGRRRLIITVTDNWSNQPPGAGRSSVDARALLLASGIVVSGVVVGDFPLLQRALAGTDRPARARLERDPLRRLLLDYFRRHPQRFRDPIGDYAAETGGIVLEAAGGDAARRLVELVGRLRGMYSFGYVPSNPARDGRFRSVTLRLSRRGASRAPGARIVARRGYYASLPETVETDRR